MKSTRVFSAGVVLCFVSFMASAQTITGSGSKGFIPKFSGKTTVVNSRIFQGATGVGISTASPTATLDVSGNVNAANGFYLGGSAFAFGSYANQNAFFGFAGNDTVTGKWNTATGGFALFANTTGDNNTGTGWEALFNNTTGSGNTAVGAVALGLNATGSFNTASGEAALYSNTSGNENTASGTSALGFNTNGSLNTAAGFGALYSNTTGSDNTAMGYNALGSNITGNSLTCIGYFCAAADGLSNATAIGADAFVAQSNSLVLGEIKGVNGAFASTNVGIGTTAPSNVFTIGQGFGHAIGDGWDTYSSRRFKTNIHPLLSALEKVEQLQGVSYERKSDGKPEIGVIAEDVAHVVPEIVSRNPTTDEIQGVDYSRLAALLIEAVKSQQAEITSQQTEIEQLKKQLQQVATKF
jgi:hypothetical protein